METSAGGSAEDISVDTSSTTSQGSTRTVVSFAFEAYGFSCSHHVLASQGQSFPSRIHLHVVLIRAVEFWRRVIRRLTAIVWIHSCGGPVLGGGEERSLEE